MSKSEFSPYPSGYWQTWQFWKLNAAQLASLNRPDNRSNVREASLPTGVAKSVFFGKCLENDRGPATFPKTDFAIDFDIAYASKQQGRPTDEVSSLEVKAFARYSPEMSKTELAVYRAVAMTRQVNFESPVMLQRHH